MSLLLTPEEAERFAAWLEQEADSGSAIIAQLELLTGPHIPVLIAREKAEVLAALTIARKIRATERA